MYQLRPILGKISIKQIDCCLLRLVNSRLGSHWGLCTPRWPLDCANAAQAKRCPLLTRSLASFAHSAAWWETSECGSAFVSPENPYSDQRRNLTSGEPPIFTVALMGASEGHWDVITMAGKRVCVEAWKGAQQKGERERGIEREGGQNEGSCRMETGDAEWKASLFEHAVLLRIKDKHPHMHTGMKTHQGASTWRWRFIFKRFNFYQWHF